MSKRILYSLTTVLVCALAVSGCSKKDDKPAQKETPQPIVKKQPESLGESLDLMVKDVEKTAADFTQAVADAVDTEQIGKSVEESVESLKESIRATTEDIVESIDTEQIEKDAAEQLDQITQSAKKAESALVSTLNDSVQSAKDQGTASKTASLDLLTESVEDSVEDSDIITGNITADTAVDQLAQAVRIGEPEPVIKETVPKDDDDFAFLDEQAESSLDAIENAQLLSSTEDQVDYLNEQAEMFYKARKFKEAADILNHILTNLDPNSEEAISLLPKTAVGLGKPAEIKKILGTSGN